MVAVVVVVCAAVTDSVAVDTAAVLVTGDVAVVSGGAVVTDGVESGLEDWQLLRADVDGSGSVDLDDAFYILQYDSLRSAGREVGSLDDWLSQILA